MNTLESLPLPLAIPAIQSSLASLEALISAHWPDFRDEYDIPDHRGPLDVIISFTSGWVVVSWAELPSMINEAKVIPWVDFLPWYASQTSQDAPGQ